MQQQEWEPLRVAEASQRQREWSARQGQEPGTGLETCIGKQPPPAAARRQRPQAGAAAYEAPAPPITPPPADNAEDVSAIRSVLEGYKSAYDTKDLARLQELWPDMSPKQVNGLRTAFRDAGKVALTYSITKGPEVAGDVAMVTFQQQIVTNAVAKSQVTMTLKKDGNNSWHITSIR